jgi:aspartate kinase
MSIIVQKYGGSSVADIDKLNKVAQIIATLKRTRKDIAVVVSAMGKTTDSLIQMAKDISADPPKREIDMLLSTGERIAMSLLCIALNKLGIDAISLTGSQSGIITNDKHNNARVIEVRPFRVLDELENGKVVVIGGFQGVSYTRDITTLGRGGSDTTAVALAAALNAERCEIYSDVEGVYSADPSIVKDAKHLPEITYEQMQEMSEAGAKVLNAQAVQFAKDANIAIYARSTFQPGKETIIRKLPAGLPKGVKAVVHENNIIEVSLNDCEDKKVFSWLLNYLDNEQIRIKELKTIDFDSQGSQVSFLIAGKDIINWEKIEKDILEKLKDNVHLKVNLGAVSLIGDGVNKDNIILNETIKILREEGILLKGITTTSFRISILVSSDEVARTTQICHHRWIEQEHNLQN